MALCAAIHAASSVKISLSGVGKRYRKQWVFRGVETAFEAGEKVAVLGPNGSGKSTLLRILSGIQTPTEGNVSWTISDGEKLLREDVFRHVAFCAPGIELVEELTLHEAIDFHFRFKKLLPGIEAKDVPAMIGLEGAQHKVVGDFSSGMKQRVKLALALFADTPAVFLDEPCTNLDDKGIAQYLGWVEAYCKEKLVVVGSNDAREYSFCEQVLEIG